MQSDKLRWWPIYHEPEHELIGRIQLYINYSTTQVDNNLKVHESYLQIILKADCVISLVYTPFLWMKVVHEALVRMRLSSS